MTMEPSVGTEAEVRLPDIGDFANVSVIEILVAPGDRVAKDASMITLESDKATMEIPAPFAGRVQELKIKLGDKLSKGDLILLMQPEAAPVQTSAPESPPRTSPTPPPSPRIASPAEVELLLPDIGDFHDVGIVELLVKPGDRVEIDSSLLTLESDKATMEIPSPQAGVITRLVVKIGDKVNRGDLLAYLQPEAQSTAVAPPRPTPEPEPSEATARRLPGEKEHQQPPVLPRPEDMVAIAVGRKPHASPAVRRFARELGVELALVMGSAPKGRITKEDVQGFIKQALRGGVARAPAPPGALALPSLPVVDFAKFGPIEQVPLERIRKLSGAHMHRSWLHTPHVTQFDEADITDLESFRKQQAEVLGKTGLKLSLLPFLLKACATALQVMPRFNASLAPDNEQLILKQYRHIGVAVDTPKGLVVPVIRDVDRKGIAELARELAEISAKAREGKLLPGDMQGGSFSISSLGGIGGTQFAPIVNAPEVAILGVSKSQTRPVWNGQEFVPRLMLPFSLSYDHRVIDGAEGVRFTGYLASLLGDIRRLLL